MATASQWLAGARPRTLPAAVAPVAAGIACAIAVTGLSVWPTLLVHGLLALLLSLSLQVGVNYANDYSDGIRGTDDDRVGPLRLTGSGAASPAAVKRAAFLSFGVGAVSGLVLVALAGAWWLLIVGAASILAGWFYTGGSKPYGYLGLGEVFVFVFFGLVAVIGTFYLVTLTVTWQVVLVACSVGLVASNILVANNLRDIPTDKESGKITLAVRLGDAGTRRLFAVFLVLAVALLMPVALSYPAAWLAVAAAALGAIAPWRIVVSARAEGRNLIPALGATGRMELLFSLALLAALGTAAAL
ncbi:1,4-dihydroxy-2-naphthoate polyprenyltransferase [Dermabacteraceae bacterium TAE3-ERU27]|nr:1,4-dihydroxy-2-naphthoate polyprenyltransferase [Dermabacteraceae bacterium TAE3-ERU27]